MNRDSIRKALTFPRWESLSGSGKADVAKIVISRAYHMKGQAASTTGEVYYFTQEELIKYLDNYYPTITTAELELAVDGGVRGEMGTKDTFVNLANIQIWIRAYYNSTERANVVDDLYKDKDAGEKVNARELNEQMYNKRIKEVYEWFCESGDIFATDDPRGVHCPAFGAVLYEEMERHGHHVIFSKESEPYLQEQAKELLETYCDKYQLKFAVANKDSYYKCILLRENFRYRKESREK